MLSRTDPLARHRPWLLAAAAYNVVWGTATLIAPNAFFDLVGIGRPNYPAIWQVVGLFVLLYAPAYVAAAQAPARSRLLVGIGFVGKLAGPTGFVLGYLTGALPAQFGLVVLFNDVIWWPFFAAYARDAWRTAEESGTL